jgi:hypothetical protein
MTYIVAGAIVVTGVYNAGEARKSRKQAESDQRALLAQQASDQAAMRVELAKTSAAYEKSGAALEDQANTAREAFEASKLNYATNKLEMERKAKEVQAAADEERRKAAASEASALKARTRGGRRSLLAGERMDAELGIPVDLSGGGMRLQ